MQFQQETRASIHNLEKQISLLASSMVELVKQRSQEIPSQTMINPKEIGSDTQLEDESENPKEPEDEKELEMNLLLEDNEASIPKKSTLAPKVTFEVSIFTDVSSPLFPSRFAKFKEEEHMQDMLETLKNLFVDVIQQVPKDAQFLDEQCTSKDDGIIIVMENASTVVQRKLHIKHSKLESFMYKPDNPKKPRMGVG